MVRSFGAILRGGRYKRRLLILALAATAVVGSAAFYFEQAHSSHSPVPMAIRQSVPLAVYYPDPGKLPVGYTLNNASFSTPQKGIVLYSVSYASGRKKLIFSLQQKPSDSDLQTFYQNQVPLHFTWPVNIGTAIVGVIRQQTFVSLPVPKDNVWIIVTGPLDVDQAQLKQVLQALRKAD